MEHVDAGPEGGHLVLVHVMASVEQAALRRATGTGFAGVVENVGKRVTAFRAGDAVYGVGDGAFAGYLCASQDEIARMPTSLSFRSAAEVPLAGLTALQALRDARLQPGERLLVIGAPGAHLHLAAQLGRHLGASVTMVRVTSPADADLVSAEGVYDVIARFGRAVTPDWCTAALARGGRHVDAAEVRLCRSGADLARLTALIDCGVLFPPAPAPPEYT